MQKGNALKALNIIHKGLLAGQVMFAAVTAYLLYSGAVFPAATGLDKILQVVALALTAAGVFAGFTVFKKKLGQIREMQGGAKEKFDQYRAACIIQWALMEGPAIFCIICFFLTGNYAFLAVVAFVIVLFVMTGPSKLKIQLQLQISEAELDEL
ncbi:MAG: hypothetical protein JNM14_02345 [Ferruginibacter sp.]|nr:hypothetical protein [Ferruginibacter sp.]